MIRISFIIPAYNCAGTIGATLDSIVSLGLDSASYEVIVVDDCSTDGTVEYVSRYNDRIPGLRVLKMESNSRQGAARNRGVSEAAGRYISFVDADDRVLPGMVKALEMSESGGADMCFSPIVRDLHGESDMLWKIQGRSSFRLSGREVCEEIFDPSCTLFLAACGYTLKRSFLQESGVTFVEGVQAEDSDFTLKLMHEAEVICYNEEPSYFYTDNMSSTVNCRKISTVIDYLLLAERLINLSSAMQDTPVFAAKVGRDVARFSLDRLALWNIGKMGPGPLSVLYESIPLQRRRRLSRLKPFSLPAFVLRHRYLTTAFITVWHPHALIIHKLGRHGGQL